MNASHGFAKLFALSATALLAGGMALAQMAHGGGQQPTPSQPQQPASPNIAGTGACPSTMPSQQQDFGAQSFVSKAIESNDTEIQLAQLAQEKS